MQEPPEVMFGDEEPEKDEGKTQLWGKGCQLLRNTFRDDIASLGSAVCMFHGRMPILAVGTAVIA